MAENKILLSDILKLAVQMHENPTEEVSQQLNKIFESLIIKNYLSTTEKGLVNVAVLGLIRKITSNDGVTAAMSLYMGKYFYGITAYIVNLIDDVSRISVTTGMIDNLFTSGLIDYVLKYCHEDFDRLMALIDDSLNFSNIFQLLEMGSYFSDETLSRYEQVIKGLEDTLTESKLQYLHSIFVSQSDDFHELKKILSEDVIKKINNTAIQTDGEHKVNNN